MSFNPISLPYITLFGVGVACFIIFKKNHRIPALITGLAFLASAYFNLMPFGGIRHSFTIAPFAFIFAGYGIDYLPSAIPYLHLPLSVFRRTVVVIIVIMLLTFLVSGTQLYSKRKSTLVLDDIIKIALKNNVEMIAGLNDTYQILLIMDNTAGKPLKKQELRLVDYRPPMNTNLTEPYILISYRCAFNPGFSNEVEWPAGISLKQFKGLNITPIKEVIGPLKPEPNIMKHQSIYYPLNGCFAYLIEPIGKR